MAVGGRIQKKEKKCRVDRSSITDGSDTCHWNRKEEECFKRITYVVLSPLDYKQP